MCELLPELVLGDTAARPPPWTAGHNNNNNNNNSNNNIYIYIYIEREMFILNLFISSLCTDAGIPIVQIL